MRGSWGSRDFAAGMAGCLVGIGGIQSRKETMQCLNGSLEKVRNLETDNQNLKIKIQNTQRRRDSRSETGVIISRPSRI